MKATEAIRLITVEASYGDRHFEVTHADNPDHVQIHLSRRSEIWVKESLINVGVTHLPCN
jgi:hypothetical protein